MESPLSACTSVDSDEDDSSDAAVNPAPPAGAGALDDVLHSDAIGDTLFSERGVLRTLMALNAAVPRYLGLQSPGTAGAAGEATGGGGDREEAAPAGEGNKLEGADVVDATEGMAEGGQPTTESGDTVVTKMEAEEEEPALMELDAELEEQLCQLWDMAAEPAVAAFLGRSGLLDVAWPLLDRSPCPRLLEILAGTLANCAGHGAAALPGGAATAADIVARLVSNSRGDAPVLRETLRLAQAAACALPEPAPLLRALAGWLPLLAEVLRGALSAPLLRQALGLLVAVAELPGQHDWWLAELAAVAELPAAVVEGLAQLVGVGGAGVTAEEALDCCRDALVLLAEVETVEGAAHGGSDAWLTPVPRLVRGVSCAWRVSDADADPRLACCLLWLAAPSLRRNFSGDTLTALLRFCGAALRGGGGSPSGDAGTGPDGGRPAAGPAAGRHVGEAPAGPTEEAASEVTMAEEPTEDELAEARAELSTRLDATAAYLARHCTASVARFLAVAAGGREARLLAEMLERTEPGLARRLHMQGTDDLTAIHEDGTHRL